MAFSQDAQRLVGAYCSTREAGQETARWLYYSLPNTERKQDSHTHNQSTRGSNMTQRRNFTIFVVSATFVAAMWIVTNLVPIGGSNETANATATSGVKIVEAARAFEATLEPGQKKKASFSYDDPERFNWHFIPRERNGLAVKELSKPQRQKLEALLKAGLSKVGFDTVENTRFLESVLRRLEGSKAKFDRNPDLYFISIFGEPNDKTEWGWRFEGHHLCLNFALKGADVRSATPLFFGANPAKVADGPRKGLRVLAGVEDIAHELMKSLDAEQRKIAVGEGEPVEVKSVENKKYVGPFPAGIKAKAFNDEQKRTLNQLIQEHTKHLAADLKLAVEKEIQAGGVDKITLSWRGGLESGQGHSYIVYGPSFVISYANFQNNAMHIHSAFRDVTNEFGVGK